MTEPLALAFDVPFSEAIAWAKDRIAVLPEIYFDALPAQARSRAFTVSGLARLDQVQGVLDSLTRATESGETFAQWKKKLTREALALGKPHLDNIFRTAIQTHYGIGRWQQHEANKAHRPFLMYDAINDGRTRPHHRALDNFIAPIDDPIWGRIAPPNGFRCRCSTRSLTEAQARARGWNGTPQYPADGGADAGWEYNPAARMSHSDTHSAIDRIQRMTDRILMGQDAALAKVVSDRMAQCDAFDFAGKRKAKPVWCDDRGMDYLKTLSTALDGAGPMPEPRRMNPPLLPTGMDERYYLSEFMRKFGADPTETAIVKDKTGLFDLAVSDLMFEDHKTGKSKITKNGRAPWLLYLAETILDPDEIRLVEGGHGDKSMYLLGRYIVRGSVTNLIAVFKQDGRVWTGWTGYQSNKSDYLEEKRSESILIFRRSQ